jgi:hypothetical protein
LFKFCVKGCVFVGGSCFKSQNNNGECEDFGSNSRACESTENLFIPIYEVDKVVEIDDNGNDVIGKVSLSRLIIFFF